jgi:putative addiction module killer protein
MLMVAFGVPRSIEPMYRPGYTKPEIRIHTTSVFADWLGSLRDARGRARILARLESIAHGSLGDTRGVGGGIRELRVHVGPGYRVYFVQRAGAVLLLLCGGDKSTQARDIERARRLLRDYGG